MSGFRAGDHLFLIDASGYIYRAFHALPPLTRASDGMPVGALAGFASMLHKFLLRLKEEEEHATHIAAVFDAKGPTFRDAIYSDYKANRSAMPEELRPQMPLARHAAAAFGLAVVEQQGVEADDLIASYAVLAAGEQAKVSIVSSDKDLMQLVGPNVRMVDSMKDRIIGIPEVEERFGVLPEKVVEVQALAGDSSDNIPGAPGIGVKTAALLLREYGSLDALLAHAEEIPQPKRRAALVENREQIEISRQLAQLKQDCELPVPVEGLRLTEPEPEKVLGFLQEMEFRTLTRRIAKEMGQSGELDLAAPPPPAQKTQTGGGALALRGVSLEEAAEEAARVYAEPDYPAEPEILRDGEALRAWCDKVRESGALALEVPVAGEENFSRPPVGMGMALAAGEAVYLPFAAVEPAALQSCLAPLLADPSITKYCHEGKKLLRQLAAYKGADLSLTAFEDTKLISYAFRPASEGRSLEALAVRHLEQTPPALSDLMEVKRGQKLSFDFLAEERAAFYAARRADMIFRLARILLPMMVLAGKDKIYRQMDLPLSFVLTRMEARGIALDLAMLQKMGADFAGRLDEIAEEIYTEAGARINLASPKQIADLLFTELGLRGGKKTRTGQWSTEAGFLEDLAAQGEVLPQKILDWRHLAKLKSTYTDSLPNFINPESGRVHTYYAMSATSTGRLASLDPNLQNIPIRTEEGRGIRKAFIAPQGKVLLSADYSQIELRVLAVLADAASLKRAFAEGQDIHAATAAEIFNLPLAEIDEQARRRAKGVNFGLIYGQTAFGLARSLKIPRDEADAYIQAYYTRFPEIPDFMARAVEHCRRHGFVETYFGRRCHFPLARGGARRGHLERAAINAPVQGTAADLVRRAMNRMESALAEAGVGAKMLLQIHDELIFEVAEGEIDSASAVIRGVMERAAEPLVTFPVALKVDIGTGTNWDTAH